MVNKMNKTPLRSQARTADMIAKHAQEFGTAGFTIAKIAGTDTNPDTYYNPRSRVIALKYRGNVYWAYYVTDFTFPKPSTHDILWIYLSKVEEQPDNKPLPDDYPDLMSISLAFAIQRAEVPNLVDSTGIGAMTAGYVRDAQEEQVVYPGKSDGLSGARRTGLAFNKKSGDVLLKSTESELLLTDEGVDIRGKVINDDMTRKAFFSENPLGFLIPETIVTFPVSMKYLPDLDFIENIGSLISDLNDIRGLIKTSEEL